MHAGDTGLLFQALTEPVQVDVRWRALHQRVRHLPEQPR